MEKKDSSEKSPLLSSKKELPSTVIEKGNNGNALLSDKPSFKKTVFAYSLGFISMLISSLSIACVQLLGGAIPEFELNIWRFVTQFVLAIPFVVKSPSHLKIPRVAALPMTGVLVIYVVHNTAFYSSPAYLPVGILQAMATAVCLSVTVLLSICIKSQRAAHLYVSALVCIAGIILLIQPMFLFKNSALTRQPQSNWTSPCLIEQQDSLMDYDLNSNKTEEFDEYTGNSGSQAVGYVLITISGTAMGTGLFFTSAAMKHVSPICVTFWVGLLGTVVSVIPMLILETPTFPQRTDCILFLLAHAFGTAQSSFVYPYCMKHVVPSIFALILAMKLVFLLALQSTVLSEIKPGLGNWVEMLGGAICFLGSAIGPITQLVKEKRQMDKAKQSDIQ